METSRGTFHKTQLDRCVLQMTWRLKCEILATVVNGGKVYSTRCLKEALCQVRHKSKVLLMISTTQTAKTVVKSLWRSFAKSKNINPDDVIRCTWAWACESTEMGNYMQPSSLAELGRALNPSATTRMHSFKHCIKSWAEVCKTFEFSKSPRVNDLRV